MIRSAFSWLLWAITAALVIVGIAGLVSGNAGVAYLFVIALFTGSGARVVVRGRGAARPAAGAGTSGTAPDWPDPAASGLARPPARDDACAEPAWTERDLRHRHRDSRAPRPARPPVDPQVRYAERASNLPLTGAAISVVLLAAGLAGLAAIGGPNGQGGGAAGAVFLLLTVVSVIYVLFLLIDLPNGIWISDGRFAVGVRGVRPAGRMWRRIEGPLDAVRTWEVLSPAQAKQLRQERAAERKAGHRRQYLGDLRLFGRRGALRLRVDMPDVQASLPAHILVGYVFVQASAAGAIWDGTVIIGTRHGAALAAALEQALPGRQAAPGSIT